MVDHQARQLSTRISIRLRLSRAPGGIHQAGAIAPSSCGRKGLCQGIQCKHGKKNASNASFYSRELGTIICRFGSTQEDRWVLWKRSVCLVLIICPQWNVQLEVKNSFHIYLVKASPLNRLFIKIRMEWSFCCVSSCFPSCVQCIDIFRLYLFYPPAAVDAEDGACFARGPRHGVARG